MIRGLGRLWSWCQRLWYTISNTIIQFANTKFVLWQKRESSNETSEQRFGDPISDDKLKEKHRESIPKRMTNWKKNIAKYSKKDKGEHQMGFICLEWQDVIHRTESWDTDRTVSTRSWHRSSAVNAYKSELTPMLRDISNTLAPAPTKSEFQSDTNNSKTLKTPQDFRQSVFPQRNESDDSGTHQHTHRQGKFYKPFSHFMAGA